MKKQFNRMKQLANQTVGRAEKTEVLSDDLLQIERRMEVVRLVSHNTHKKMVTYLQGHVGADAEKRHKKLPLMSLSQAMMDGGSQLGEECMIGKMMELCGEAESKLAYEQSQHEVQLEREVLDPINQLAENDIPNIMKQRKQLAKLVLDYDSAKARYLQANKAILTATNNQAMAAKADSCKEEMDEAHNKVEICKDQLAADMYNFFSKEGEYARYYVMLLEAQAEYHRRSLACIESVLPAIRSQQETWMEKPAFGTSLEEHLKRSNREIALPIEACVMMLLETGMKEEGLFRIAAGASKLKKLKAALDCSTSQLEEFYSDPHAVAGALKSYLRELPEPLMTFQLYDEWNQASNVSDPDKRLQALWVTCDNLPKANKANLRYLVKFLAKLAQDSEVNKMTPSNIAIVLGPNLLWAKTEGTLAEMAAATSVHVVAIIEPIIQHADWFFPEDVEFNVSGMFAMPTGPVHQSGYPATPEPEYATVERRRPGSQGAPETETPRKDSKHPEHAPRRTGTLNRKQQQQQQQHTSPAFQPPLPPVEAGGVPLSEAPSQSAVGGSEAGAIMTQNQQSINQQQSADESSSVVREPTSTPPPLRNGPGGPSGTPGQLSVGTPTSASKGPSPHMVRRGTKKQAPAPPKMAPNSSSATTPPKATSTPSIQAQSPAASPGQPVTLPRRHSSNQMPIHAPSHPPPQPPQNTADPEPSPPHSPTRPDTPPHDFTHSAFLSRPRPVPRPRPRPSVPPPPQPPSESTNGVCNSASKIITDMAITLKGSGRLLVPHIDVEQPVTTPYDAESQSESTIL